MKPLNEKLPDRLRSNAMPTPRVRSAIASRFRAGDSVVLLAWDYDVQRAVVEECIREALKRKRAGKRTA